MSAIDLIDVAKELFAKECEARRVKVKAGIGATWGVMLSQPRICSFAIGPKHDGQKPQAVLFIAVYTKVGDLVSFEFPEGTNNKYFTNVG